MRPSLRSAPGVRSGFFAMKGRGGKEVILRRFGITALALAGLVRAQYPSQPNLGGGSLNGLGPPSGNGPGSSNSQGNSTSNTGQRQPRTGSADSSRGAGQEGIWGGVLLSDGAEPGPDIMIQRICGQSVTGEAHPDSEGRFTLQPPPKGAVSDSPRDAGADLPGCELRASMSGYMTATLPLGSGHSAGNGEVMMVLRHIGNKGSMTVSATTLLAPKDARNAYNKGLDAARRNSPDEAQKRFLSAVRIYARYAAAWLELGKVYEQRGHLEQAREAYNKSIAADGGYLYPYVRLYHLDMSESRWEEAAETSAKVVRLNPYEFSEAFYFNAVANLELNHLDAAEHSAQQAGKLEGERAEPRANFVLGVILWRKGDLAGAEEKLKAFLADGDMIGSAEHASARKMLTEVQEQSQHSRR